jgi:hypothetical protein
MTPPQGHDDDVGILGSTREEAQNLGDETLGVEDPKVRLEARVGCLARAIDHPVVRLVVDDP